MNDFTKYIKNNTFLSWLWAVILGLVFYISYGVFKKLLWSWDLNRFVDWIDPATDDNLLMLTIILNAIVDSTSALPAAILSAILLVKFVSQKELIFGMASLLLYVVLDSRLWRFASAPNLGMQISSVMGPIIAGAILMFSILIFARFKKEKSFIFK
jgi:hypothetical protein